MNTVNILVVEDDKDKTKKIKKSLQERFSIIPKTCQCANDCLEALKANQYDILVLDLVIAHHFEEEVDAKNGLSVLQTLETLANKPTHIILFTGEKETYERYANEIKKYPCKIIIYDASSNEWEYSITDCIHCVQNLKKCSKEIDAIDVALIAALPSPELNQMLALSASSEYGVEGDSTVYYNMKFYHKNGKELNIIAASSNQMGMVAATDLTAKILHHFKPKIVIMGGIAAGISGGGGYGDVLIAELCYDYGSGKWETIEEEIIFKPDHRQISINSDLTSKFKQIQTKRTYLDQIKKKCTISKPRSKLNVHFGIFASGAGVIASKEYTTRLKDGARKLIGFDMEAYGVYYACHYAKQPKPKYFLSIKSISDKGDSQKNDNYQEYAAYTSAQYIYHLLTESDLFELD